MVGILVFGPAPAIPPAPRTAAGAAIHIITTQEDLSIWLHRIPATQMFPPDFGETLSGHGSAFIIETSTSVGCIPCADLWSKLGTLRRLYGVHIMVLNHEQAVLRSGRLALPWVGDPVVWVRPIQDENQTVPIAVGTDLLPNLERNLYLAVKMLTGVRPDVGVRAMSRFTGLVAGTDQQPTPRRRNR